MEWEAAATEARNVGTRVVLPRIGLVLGPDGGALGAMLKPFQLGFGGRLGNGRQWMPWIFINDIVRLLMFLAEHDELQGPVNATSPEPCTNAQFTTALGAALNRPTLLPVPSFALRMALGQFADVLLASQRVLPDLVQQAGFTFQMPRLEDALAKSLASLT